MLRGLAIYLSLFLCFPPQVWAQLGNSPREQGASARLESDGGKKERETNLFPENQVQTSVEESFESQEALKRNRVELRQKLHLATWKLQKVIKAKIPGALYLKPSSYLGLLAPYEHCDSPDGKLGDSVESIDELILKPAQEAVAAFLNAHIQSQWLDRFEEISEVPTQSEVVFSATAKVACYPALRPASHLAARSLRASAESEPRGVSSSAGSKDPLSPNSDEALWQAAQASAQSVQEPFSLLLSRKSSTPVTGLEARRWVGWVMGLREFRNLAAKFYAFSTGSAPVPPPRWAIPDRLGKILDSHFRLEKNGVKNTLSHEASSQSSLVPSLSGLPSWVLCGKSQWCFQDGTEPISDTIEQDIFLKWYALPATHGRDLETLRSLGIKALLTELASVNTLISDSRQPFPEACVSDPSLSAHQEYFESLSESTERSPRALAWSEAVQQLEAGYGRGEFSLPVPSNPRFFAEAESLVTEFFDSYFQSQWRAASGKTSESQENPQLAELNRFREMLSFEESFSSPVGEASFRLRRSLQEKLRVWFVLMNQELGTLAAFEEQESRAAQWLPDVVRSVFQQALWSYVEGLAKELSLDLDIVQSRWDAVFDSRWNQKLESAPLISEVRRAARQIAQDLREQPAWTKKYDKESIADEVLGNYVKNISPTIRAANQAQDTVEYLQSLIEWKNGPESLVPSPLNYSWQLSKFEKPRGLGASPPSFFQWDDGRGHGYGETLWLADATKPEEYLHVQGALKSIAARHREALIQRLKSRGFTDERLQQQFGTASLRDVGTLADRVIQKFQDLVEADPTKDSVRSAKNRYESIGPLLDWLRSEDARVEYRSLIQKRTQEIYDEYLRDWVRPKVSSVKEASLKSTEASAAFSQLIARAVSEAKLPGKVSVQSVIPIVTKYRERMISEIETEDVRLGRSVMGKVRSEWLEKDLFGSADLWVAFCQNDHVACAKLVSDSSIPFENAGKLKPLFLSRASSTAEDLLLHFGRLFVEKAVAYDGSLPNDVALSAVVESTKENLLNLFVGWLSHQELREETAKFLDTLLQELTQKALLPEASVAEVVFAIKERINSRVEKEFDSWNRRLHEALQKIQIAIAAKEASQIEAVFTEVKAIFHFEMMAFEGYPRRGLAEVELVDHLSRLLFPSFTQLRLELEPLIAKTVSAVQDPISQALLAKKALQQLKDEQWSLKQAGQDKSARFHEIEKAILLETERFGAATDRVRAFEDLKTYLRYGLTGLSEAGLVERAFFGENEVGSLWDNFFSDHFRLSRSDSLGQPMLLSVGEVIEDLNQVASGVRQPLRLDRKTVERFLNEVIAYSEALPKDPEAVALVAEALDLKRGILQWASSQWQTRYWQWVHAFTVKLGNQQGASGPRLLPSGKVVALTVAPSQEVPITLFDKSVEDEAQELSELQTVFSRAALSESDWAILGESLPPPISHEPQAVREWLNRLGAQERRQVWERAKSRLIEAVKEPREWILGEGPTTVSYREWHQGLRKRLLYWDSVKSELKKNPSDHLSLLARQIAGWFLAKAPYQFDGKHWVARSSQSDSGSLEALTKASLQIQWRAIEDAETLYNRELRRKSQEQGEALATQAILHDSVGAPLPRISDGSVEPFGDGPKNGTESNSQVTVAGLSSAQWELLFQAAPQRAKAAVVTAPSFQDWQAYWEGTSQLGVEPHSREFSRFEWQPELVGQSLKQQEMFQSWVSELLKVDSARTNFLKLKELAVGAEAQRNFQDEAGARQESGSLTSRPRIWKLYQNLEEFVSHQLFAQVLGVLAVHDTNQRAVFQPKTYPFFIAQLQANIRLGVPTSFSPTPVPIPISEAQVGKLLDDLVAVMGLNMKSMSGWESLLRNKGEPEDWLSIAESQRNFLVGVGARRFLSTLTEVESRNSESTFSSEENSGSISRDVSQNYRPLPVVDFHERDELAPSMPFELWFQKLEHRSTSSLTHVTSSRDPKPPLFSQLGVLQLEMFGEKDLQEKRSNRHGPGDSNENGFGARLKISPERVALFQNQTELFGKEIASVEISRILSLREALVDFRKTLNGLNTRYRYEPSRYFSLTQNEILTRSTLEEEVLVLCEKLAKQLGISEIPSLKPSLNQGQGLASSDLRREVIARAIYWASKNVHDKVFQGASLEQAESRRQLLRLVDQFYLQEVQKRKVRQGLAQVAVNISEQLKKLCAASAVSQIVTDEEFRKSRKLIVEDSQLVFFDNLIQLFYFGSGLVTTGQDSQPQTRRLLAEMARRQSELKENFHRVGTVVNWVVAISLVTLLLGKMNPALGRVAMRSQLARVVMLTLAHGAAVGFGIVEGSQIYDDFVERPNELKALMEVRDTVFLGNETLMGDEAASLVPYGQRKLSEDQKSIWRWSMHLLGLTAGLQVLGPSTRWAFGGVKHFLSLRSPYRAVEVRFRRVAKFLGVTQEGSAFERFVGLGHEERDSRRVEAYARELVGKVTPQSEVAIPRQTRELLHHDANRQRELLAKQVGLDPRTLVPTQTPEGLTPASRLVGRWQQEAMGQARNEAMERLVFLRDFARRLESSNATVSPDDVIALLGGGLDPAVRHTPLLWSVLGIPYPSHRIRDLRKLVELVHADLDLLALHDPQTLKLLGYFHMLSLPGGRVEAWELFSPVRTSRLTDIPKEVRQFLDGIYSEASLLTKSVPWTPSVAESSRIQTLQEAEMAKLRFIREAFDDCLRGVTWEPRRWPLVQRTAPVVEAFSSQKYSFETLQYYQERYLREKGLSLHSSTRQKMKFLHELARWSEEAGPALNEFAKRFQTSREEVLYWILHPNHPNAPKMVRSQPEEAVLSAESALFGEKPQHKEMADYARELQELFRSGSWEVDTEFLKALSQSEYRVLASRLRRMTTPASLRRGNGSSEEAVTGPDTSYEKNSEPQPGDGLNPKVTPSAGPEAKSLPHPGAEAETRPLSEPEANLPLARETQGAGNSKNIASKEPIPSLSVREIPSDILQNRRFGPVHDFNEMMKLMVRHVPESEREWVVDLLLQRVSAKDLQRTLGRWRRLGLASDSVVASYQWAIAHTRAMEIAESLPTQSERLAFYRWAVEESLKSPGRWGESFFGSAAHVSAFGAGPVGVTPLVSVSEARELLQLPSGTWGEFAAISRAAEAAKSQGVKAEWVDAAEALLKKLHPDRRELNSLEGVSALLNIPADFLGVEAVARSFLRERVTFEADAELMFIRLYSERFEKNVQDAAWLLGLAPNSSAEAISARADSLSASLKALLAKASAPQRVLHERALERIGLASRILKNPARYPAKYVAPQTMIPRYEMPNVALEEDRWFRQEASGYPRSMVEKALARGVDKARLELWHQIAKEELGALKLTTEERLSRLMHVALLLRNAEAAKCFSSRESLQKVSQVLLESYVRSANVRFRMTSWEAEETLYVFYKHRLGYSRDELKLHQDENFEKLFQALYDEQKLLQQGKPNISQEMLSHLTLAAVTLRNSRTFGAYAQPLMSLEAAALTSYSHAPVESLVSLIQLAERNPSLYPDIKKLIYHYLDGPRVRWTPQGTHSVGDLFLSVFGPQSGVRVSLSPSQEKGILEELSVRWQWVQRQAPVGESRAELPAETGAFVPENELEEVFQEAISRLVPGS